MARTQTRDVLIASLTRATSAPPRHRHERSLPGMKKSRSRIKVRVSDDGYTVSVTSIEGSLFSDCQLCQTHARTHARTHLTALFQDYLGEPVPER